MRSLFYLFVYLRKSKNQNSNNNNNNYTLPEMKTTITYVINKIKKKEIKMDKSQRAIENKLQTKTLAKLTVVQEIKQLLLTLNLIRIT